MYIFTINDETKNLCCNSIIFVLQYSTQHRTLHRMLSVPEFSLTMAKKTLYHDAIMAV